jgi:monoterpene epsilon-lactone hydrolase
MITTDQSVSVRILSTLGGQVYTHNFSAAFRELDDVLRAARQASKDAPAPDYSVARAAIEAMVEWGLPHPEVRVDTLTGPLPGLALASNVESAQGRILYLHGGGYFGGSSRSHIRLATRLCAESACDVSLIDYRLAPEHRHPAALDDALLAYRNVLETDGKPPILAGDSAGGGLALATALAVRDNALPAAPGVVMMSPWLDLTLDHDASDDDDVLVSRKGLERNVGLMFGESGNDVAHRPAASPLFGDFHELPPFYVQVGSEELLRIDAERLEAVCLDIGHPCTVEVLPGMFHTFQLCAGRVPEADAAVRRLGEWIRDLHEPVSP